ncbi:MAG: ThiF family adenylyltransferase [Ardenticatenales bacterium]|nr:ThiF family adenylyltransferase [Ardenticatenales bacterium]
MTTTTATTATTDRRDDPTTARHGPGPAARNGGTAPHDRVAPCPRRIEDDLAGFLNRTCMLVGPDALRTLSTKTVAIAGCGGVGGAVAITLVRMGVGGFTLADPGDFDPPDMNRQWAATHDSLGRNKVDTYADVLRSIQPAVRLATFTEGVTTDNLGAFLDGADVVVDCLDVSVPPMLRVGLYQMARAKGLHVFCAPMLGFGAIVVNAAPYGMPMEDLFGRVMAEAVATSTLPDRLRDLVVPEHIDAIERHLRNLKAPSVAISPMLSASLISTEIYLVLVGEDTPGWRPPHCLPEVMVVDPIRGTFRVLALQDLVAPRDDIAAPGLATPDARRDALAAAGWNTVRLPHGAIAVDLMSDSWRERARSSAATSSSAAPADVEALLTARYGFPHIVPVHRGRFAEALLAKALIRPGAAVVTNALFPTTRFHLESAGALVLEFGLPEADDLYDPHPFKGELDLDRLANVFAGVDADDCPAPILAVYVELGANAIGGHAVRLSHLRAVRDLAAAHGVPVLIDATRAYANAALVRERESGQAGRPLGDIVRDLCACATACTASLSKDFVTPVGGFVGTHDAALFVGLRDLAVLAYGDGLGEDDRALMAAAVAGPATDDGTDDGTDDSTGVAATARASCVRRLHEALTARSIPVVGPPGGHAVYVDAAAFLPHLAPEDHRATALANALFVAGGVRVGAHLGTPRQAAAGVDLVRLAVPVGGVSEADVERVVEAFRQVQAERAGIGGWRRVDEGGGRVGELVTDFTPA